MLDILYCALGFASLPVAVASAVTNDGKHSFDLANFQLSGSYTASVYSSSTAKGQSAPFSVSGCTYL